VGRSKPFLILEDGLLLCAKFGQISSHLAAVIERVCEPAQNAVLLYLGGHVE
jgi:hypothetical protein